MSDHWQMRKRALNWYSNTQFYLFFKNSQTNLLSADFCIVQMCNFDSNMFYFWLNINLFGIKIISYVNIVHVFCLDVTFAWFSSDSEKLTVFHNIKSGGNQGIP